MQFLVLLLGWPAVIASLWLTGVGLVRARAGFVLAGALSASPFLLYLFGTPRFGWRAALVALLHYGSAAVAPRHRALAVAMAAPFVALVIFVAWLAASSWAVVHG